MRFTKLVAVFVLSISYQATSFADISGSWAGQGFAKDSAGWSARCQYIEYNFHMDAKKFYIDDGEIFCGALHQRSWYYELTRNGQSLYLKTKKVGTLIGNKLQVKLYDKDGVQEFLDVQLNAQTMIFIHRMFYMGNLKRRVDGQLTKLSHQRPSKR